MDKVQAMAKAKAGKIFKTVGWTLEIIGPAMTIHRHSRAGLVLAGIGIPLLIAGNELNKKENKQVK